jgi:hypothetical protein
MGSVFIVRLVALSPSTCACNGWTGIHRRPAVLREQAQCGACIRVWRAGSTSLSVHLCGRVCGKECYLWGEDTFTHQCDRKQRMVFGARSARGYNRPSKLHNETTRLRSVRSSSHPASPTATVTIADTAPCYDRPRLHHGPGREGDQNRVVAHLLVQWQPSAQCWRCAGAAARCDPCAADESASGS